MTPSHRISAVLLCCSLAILLLSGCAPIQSAGMKSAFAPPGNRPISAEPEYLTEPPPVAKEFVKELPQLFPSQPAAAKTAVTDSRMVRAEERFEAGKRAYQTGNRAEARKAFDQAVDLLLTAPDANDRARLERRLDEMVETIYRYDVNGLGAAEDADKIGFDKAPVDELLDLTPPIDPSLKPKVSEEIRATVSQLPLEESDSVLSYVHFFQTDAGRQILTYGLKRAGKYRALIERVLDEEGVPRELIYLAQAESGFMPRAVSYRAAAGMWQFISARGIEYGLSISGFHDDRLDPEKATRAAARHLRDLFNHFGDWYLAMAAYNCGPGCVDWAVQRTGYADFWTLRKMSVLPTETANYVPAILAITIMAKNPKDYGLDGIETDRPLEWDSVRADHATNLALVADALERPISEIRELNPSLLRGIVPQGGELRVPKGSIPALTAAIESVPAAKRDSWRLHRVEQGESLAAIGKRYATAPAAIASANNFISAAPETGDVLLIPVSYSEPVPVRRVVRTRTAAAPAARKPAAKAAAAAKPVPGKVLNQRAPARHVRTASATLATRGQ